MVTQLSLGPRRVAVRRVLSWGGTDWEAFNGQLLIRLGGGPPGLVSTPEDIDISVDHMTAALQ